MLLNLNDPESIVAWWKVLPDQHEAYLDHKIKVSPEFAPSIAAAHRRIAEDPQLRALRVQCIQRRRQNAAYREDHEGALTAQELRWRQLAAA